MKKLAIALLLVVAVFLNVVWLSSCGPAEFVAKATIESVVDSPSYQDYLEYTKCVYVKHEIFRWDMEGYARQMIAGAEYLFSTAEGTTEVYLRADGVAYLFSKDGAWFVVTVLRWVCFEEERSE